MKDIKGANWEESWARLRKLITSLYLEHTHLTASLPLICQRDFEAIINDTGDNIVFGDSLKNLITYLHDFYQQPVVVLIDEYDSPMIDAWENNYYRPMADFMRAWLGGGLKPIESAASFRSVVTGILRVAKESIFSGLNNMKVWSMLQPGGFADKFGFTQLEVDKLLADFARPELASAMQEWYNGYDFGGVTIYNPWSVINAIDNYPEPLGPYWLNTASNTLVLAELDGGGMALKGDLEKLLAGEELRYPILSTITFEDIGRDRTNIWSFLFYAGYLKATEPAYNPLDRSTLTYRLQIPNIEVSLVYKQFIARFFEEQIRWDDNTVQHWLQALLACDWPRFEARLQNLVENLFSYHDIGHYQEAVFHAFTLGLLANLRSVYEIHSNPETGYGRADILLRPRGEQYPLGFVIEFKSLPADGDLEQSVTDALAQIEAKQYAARLLEAGVPVELIRKLAVVVSGRRVKVRADVVSFAPERS